MTARIHRNLGQHGVAGTLTAATCWLATLSLALVACGGGESEESEDTAATSTPAPAAAVEAPKADITKPGSMPTGFDLPTPPDAEPAGSMAVPGGGSLSAFKASASLSDVFAFYLSELPKQGWTIDSQNDEQTEIRATSGDRNVSIRLVSHGGTTEIAIVEGG